MLEHDRFELEQAEAEQLTLEPQQALLEAMGFDPVSLDALMARSGWPAAKLSAALLELELEAELEEIKRNAEAMQRISVQNKPSIVFDVEDDHPIPTLAQHLPEPQPIPVALPKKEINETASGNNASLNDKLKQTRIDLGETLTEVPIRDLKKAIGVNDRFLYINELFRGDESMYERSIKTINGFSILPEAEYWIQRELKVKLAWNDGHETVKQFTQLVKRRFT